MTERDLTKKEKEWITRFKRCLRSMPKSISIHINNELMEFQVYDPETKKVLTWINHGFEQGDPL